MIQIKTIFQLIIFGAWSIFSILIATLFCLLTLSNKPTVFFAKYMWSPVALIIFGGRLRIEGYEKIKDLKVPYVVMSNHCSYLDIPVIFKTFPVYLYFVAKKELRRMPFLGWFMILAGMIFIDRKNTASAKESLSQAAELIRNGKHIVIFPEGTASKDGKVASFKKGGFHMADEADAWIVPVQIEGTYKVWPSASKLKARSGIITVKIADPVSPDEYRKLDLEERIDKLRNTIIEL